MMRREEFIKQIEENISDMTLDNLKSIIIQLGNKVPNSFFETMLCIIINMNGTLDESNLDILKKEIYDDFKKIENGTLNFKCYSYETGTYSYYDADMDYEYYLTPELKRVLNKTYNFVVSSVLHKRYADAIEITDLLLYTEYSCDKVGDPEYSDTEEVCDTFEKNIEDVKESLDFDLGKLLLYATYSVIMGNYSNKKEKIFEYSKYGYIDLGNVKSLGVEEIKDFDKFYKEWLEFLEKKER